LKTVFHTNILVSALAIPAVAGTGRDLFTGAPVNIEIVRVSRRQREDYASTNRRWHTRDEFVGIGWHNLGIRGSEPGLLTRGA
jgi:hypothetical protein